MNASSAARNTPAVAAISGKRAARRARLPTALLGVGALTRAARLQAPRSRAAPPRARPLARRLGLRPLRLVDALGGLVVRQRLRGVHVAERGVRRNEPLRRLQLVALGEHRAQRLDLHLP